MDNNHPRISWDTPMSELIDSDDNLSYIDLDEGELVHWKYIKREKLPNGKWRYYYDKSALKKDVKSSISKIRSKFKTISDNKSKTSKSSVKKTKRSFVDRLKVATSKVENIVSRTKKKVHKYIAKVPTDSGTYRYFYSDKAYKAYLNGKKATDKALNKVGDKKMGSLIGDVVKNAVDSFIGNVMNSGFGKALYNLALPALTAVQVALQTPKSLDDLKRSNKKYTNDEHQEVINPDYDPKKFDYSYNCSFCTAAYDLRKRGYDVEAMPISVLEGPVIDDIVSWYDGAKPVTEKEVSKKLPANERHNVVRRSEALNESLEKQGDGARGHLAMYWSMGGGHDIVWEVENGEVVFRDCQTNQVVDITETLRYVDNYTYVRVDNCDLTEEVLRTVRNKK